MDKEWIRKDCNIDSCEECKKKSIIVSADFGGKYYCVICGRQIPCNSIGQKPVTCGECIKKGYCRWCGKRINPELCMSCGKEKAMLNYCESVLDFTHGNITQMCKTCYRKKLMNTITNCQEELKKLD